MPPGQEALGLPWLLPGVASMASVSTGPKDRPGDQGQWLCASLPGGPRVAAVPALGRPWPPARPSGYPRRGHAPLPRRPAPAPASWQRPLESWPRARSALWARSRTETKQNKLVSWPEPRARSRGGRSRGGRTAQLPAAAPPPAPGCRQPHPVGNFLYLQTWGGDCGAGAAGAGPADPACPGGGAARGGPGLLPRDDSAICAE